MTTQISIFNLTDIVHSCAGNFTGRAPETTPTSTGVNRIEWPVSTEAGLFDPAALGLTNGVRVLRVALFMAGQDTWAINLIDGTSSGKVASGTTETFWADEAVTLLMGGQKLQLVTTGAGTTSVKMICTVADVNAITPAPKGV